MVLVVVILMMAVLTILGTTAMLATSTDLLIGSNYRMNEQALYAAESGAEYGLNRLRAALLVLNGSTSTVVPPTISGFTFENTGSFLALSGGVQQKTVTGNFAGLTGFCQKYIITSAALQSNTNARATVVYELEDQLIPLFQFGIFFQNDLEMLPGANMSFTGGRIHSNNDIYMFPYGTN
ncbi:MAG: pilus assembly PilX N-terminal domain-containing protein, partial [Syntrophales bacterium LBB04]|nr:pilus assembly PilX N-terminal domain-containing protein [Syntrophales bacterium LBB04]